RGPGRVFVSRQCLPRGCGHDVLTTKFTARNRCLLFLRPASYCKHLSVINCALNLQEKRN
ncbi:MAG: hypothetical protein JW761_13585, partial [Prolixibacteraceae bacterium]|nr:hypothetical protein [Prolixibacteraceae bacterium]